MYSKIMLTVASISGSAPRFYVQNACVFRTKATVKTQIQHWRVLLELLCTQFEPIFCRVFRKLYY